MPRLLTLLTLAAAAVAPSAQAAAAGNTVCDRFGIAWNATLAKQHLTIYGTQQRRAGHVTECAYLLDNGVAFVGCFRVDLTPAAAIMVGQVRCAHPFANGTA